LKNIINITTKTKVIFVTKPANIDHVGTLIYLRNISLKYLMAHNFPVPANCIRLTWEAQQGSNYILVNNHTSTFYLDLLVFSESFSDVAQIIMSTSYKGQVSKKRGWWAQVTTKGVVTWSPNHTTRQSRLLLSNSHGWLGAVSHQCHLIKICQPLPQSFQRVLQGHEKLSGKADLAIYSFSVDGTWV